MSAKVFPNKGKSIKSGNAASPTTVLGNVLDFDIQGGDREMFDTTNQLTSGTMTSQPEPLRAPRKIEVKLQFDPTDTEHQRIYAAYLAGTLEYETFILSSGVSYAFSSILPLPVVP